MMTDEEQSEQDEVDGVKKGADSTGEVMHIKERLVICNEEDTKHLFRLLSIRGERMFSAKGVKVE